MLPLWEATKVRPTGRSRSSSAALAVSIDLVRRSTTPRLDGPTTRIPVRAQSARSRASRARPSGPASAKPSASTVATFTPNSAHSSTASTAGSVGSTIYAWSGASGSAEMRGQARSPSTVSRRGFIG